MNLYGMTDIGRKREMNQDVFYTHKFNEQVGFAIVCDGMGGQSGGNVASDTTCKIISKKLMEQDITDLNSDNIKQIIVTAISEANIEVYKLSNEDIDCKGMGTTIVLAVVIDSVAYIANIGDSRAYVLKGNRLYQATKDHSLVQELLEQGKISKDEVKNHPNKNMITRAVGVSLTVDIDYLEINLDHEDKLLLCSDGLTNMVEDQMIEKVIKSNNAADSCVKLIELANKAGGVDNITVAIIE